MSKKERDFEDLKKLYGGKSEILREVAEKEGIPFVDHKLFIDEHERLHNVAKDYWINKRLMPKQEESRMSKLWWQRMGTIVLALIVAMVLQLVFIEWIVGCGESYVDANGVRHWYECVFLNFNPEGDV